jgi:hypothetical protein
MIVFTNVVVPLPSVRMPPPDPAAELLATVLFVKFVVACELYSAPPEADPVALFPLKVLLMIVIKPVLLKIPAPPCVPVLPLIVLLVMFSVPSLLMPPPDSAVLPLIVLSVIVTVPLLVAFMPPPLRPSFPLMVEVVIVVVPPTAWMPVPSNVVVLLLIVLLVTLSVPK